MHENAMLTLAGIGLIAIACQWVAWRVKLPAILFLLMAGMIAGPATGWLNPDALFGELLTPIVSLSVAVILFEGGLTLKFEDIKGMQTVVRRLATTGALLTWLVIALSAHWLLDFSLKLSLLFGAISVVTGPTVIAPMLRTVRPNAAVSNILRWEGIVIDPVGALLAVVVFELIVAEAHGGAFGATLLSFGETLALSALLGCAAGYGFGRAVGEHWLPEYLHNLAALALVFGIYVLSNEIQHESGLLAVTVMGVWLANMKRASMENILNFKESLSLLLISGLFILLAARIYFKGLFDLGWNAVGVFLVIQFVARPLKVLVSTWGSTLTWRERVLLGWIAPRGIVAAATASLFAARLVEHDQELANVAQAEAHMLLTPYEYRQAELLTPLTFMVIICTVAFQSATARFLALRLGVAEPEAKGFLIVGANEVAREIALALRECGFRVLLADDDWDHVRAARMAGLETYYGAAVSEHADIHLDLVGVGHLLALSERQEINNLACQRYRSEFGRGATYSIQAGSANEGAGKSRKLITPDDRLLFGTETDYETLRRKLAEGGKIHKTALSKQYDYRSFQAGHEQRVIPLFALTPQGDIRWFTANAKLDPRIGWTLVYLKSARASMTRTFIA
jgi:NhaP-type Na+/H+ or K+/H+ antiporter